ncbi:hypothetical protein OsI_26539 [Oryza sativa Indica Group]|uniref:Uncharacterized protein n=1 Tax=Oryza sativa subsp. indica TaxID=39946 RepID=B8B7I3_ORYSI|nr:hypothetical protein OsI_26539 [Oryza sativa Indica Group]
MALPPLHYRRCGGRTSMTRRASTTAPPAPTLVAALPPPLLPQDKRRREPSRSPTHRRRPSSLPQRSWARVHLPRGGHVGVARQLLPRSLARELRGAGPSRHNGGGGGEEGGPGWLLMASRGGTVAGV